MPDLPAPQEQNRRPTNRPAPGSTTTPATEPRRSSRTSRCQDPRAARRVETPADPSLPSIEACRAHVASCSFTILATSENARRRSRMRASRTAGAPMNAWLPVCQVSTTVKRRAVDRCCSRNRRHPSCDERPCSITTHNLGASAISRRKGSTPAASSAALGPLLLPRWCRNQGYAFQGSSSEYGTPASASRVACRSAEGSSFSQHSMPLPTPTSVMGPGSWRRLSTRACTPPYIGAMYGIHSRPGVLRRFSISSVNGAM